MKMIWCGFKIKENWHVLVNQFHENFRSKSLCFRKIKYVFMNVKWCFNESWGLKGLIRKCDIGYTKGVDYTQSISQTKIFTTY